MIKSAKPFVKWAGGKSQLIRDIRSKFPEEFGDSILKYAEPFVGGGAVLFDILNNYYTEQVYISDINHELINTYIMIRDNVDELIFSLGELEKKYLPASSDERKKMYYMKRDRFNELKLTGDSSVEIATLFIFINRTCFNGLYRVNSRGEFNVPQGSYKTPQICDKDNLINVAEKLRGVTIVCADYKKSDDFITGDSLAYFDPPYRPLTKTASFNSYAKDGFDDNDQSELARFIDRLSDRGAYIIASNSDPKNADETDVFFDGLYARHKIDRVYASRAISSVATGRGKISELLISNK